MAGGEVDNVDKDAFTMSLGDKINPKNDHTMNSSPTKVGSACSILGNIMRLNGQLTTK